MSTPPYFNFWVHREFLASRPIEKSVFANTRRYLLSLPGSWLMPNAAKRDGLLSRRAPRADCRHRGECLSTEGKCWGSIRLPSPSCIYV